MTKIEELSEMSLNLEIAEDRWLESRSWVMVCNLPGAHWWWTKDLLQGRVITDKRSALKLEKAICDFGEASLVKREAGRDKD